MTRWINSVTDFLDDWQMYEVVTRVVLIAVSLALLVWLFLG